MTQPTVTPSHIQHHGFKPYRGEDVQGHVKIDVAGHKDVWATLQPTHQAYRDLVGDEPYIVDLVGWGQAPGILWSELDGATQAKLLGTLYPANDHNGYDGADEHDEV